MNFLNGSYGFDLLSIFLLLISSFFNFSGKTSIIGLAIIILVLYRAFSKNIYKRSNEQAKLITLLNKVVNKFGKQIPYNLPRATFSSMAESFKYINYHLKQNLKQRKDYKIVKCPNCKQKLRLPRGQKHIIVTCKRCSTEFKMRT